MSEPIDPKTKPLVPRLRREDGKLVESVALVGMGPSMQSFLADMITQDRKEPIADEIWTINLSGLALRTDRIVWMDDLQEQRKNFAYCIDDLTRRDVPVLTTTAYPDLVPKSYRYPIEEVAVYSLGYFGRLYVNNSVAYALAYAHVMGVKTIKVYGCDFTYPNWNHAEKGRGCVECWLFAHVVKGGDIVLPVTTSLFDQAHGNELYGYAEQPEIHLPDGVRMRFTQNEGGRGNYVFVPPDTSGVPTHAESSTDGAVRAPVPGVERSGSGADGGAEVRAPAEAPVDSSGEGVRRPARRRRSGAGVEGDPGEGAERGPSDREAA